MLTHFTSQRVGDAHRHVRARFCFLLLPKHFVDLQAIPLRWSLHEYRQELSNIHVSKLADSTRGVPKLADAKRVTGGSVAVNVCSSRPSLFHHDVSSSERSVDRRETTLSSRDGVRSLIYDLPPEDLF